MLAFGSPGYLPPIVVSQSMWISAREVFGHVYIVGQDPRDSKSSRLHVDIFRFRFHSFEVYFYIDSSKMIGNAIVKPRTSTGYFSKSTGSSVTNRGFSPNIDVDL